MNNFQKKLWARRLQNYTTSLLTVLLLVGTYIQTCLATGQPINWNVMWSVALGGIIGEIRTRISAHDLKANPVQ